MIVVASWKSIPQQRVRCVVRASLRRHTAWLGSSQISFGMCLGHSHQPPSSKKKSGATLRKLHTTPKPPLLFAQSFLMTPDAGLAKVSCRSQGNGISPPSVVAEGWCCRKKEPFPKDHVNHYFRSRAPPQYSPQMRPWVLRYHKRGSCH